MFAQLAIQAIEFSNYRLITIFKKFIFLQIQRATDLFCLSKEDLTEVIQEYPEGTPKTVN